MRAQKKRVQARIRAWHASECREALIRDEVIPEWRAVWPGMRTQCSQALGLAISTVNRYFSGAIAPCGDIPTFCEAASAAR